MTWANRQPLSAKERVKSSLLDDDGHFRVWIDTSWNPSIRRGRSPPQCGATGSHDLHSPRRKSPIPGQPPPFLLKSCLLMIGTYTPFMSCKARQCL